MAIDPLLSRLRRELPLWRWDSAPVVVAVSGGSDSVALLHMLRTADLIPADHLLVAHLDHALRPDSAEDGQFVAQLAAQLHLPCRLERWQTPPSGGNIPALAREARYQFLLRAARDFSATTVLTAHQRDDQAETFLEHLLRGSGVTGLGSMAIRRPLAGEVWLVRPLLSFRRQELCDWLQKREIGWREDPSNHNLHRRRNRLRHRLVPLLAQLEGMDPVETLAATAERLQQADAALEWALDRTWRDVIHSHGPTSLSFNRAALLPLPPELLQRALARAVYLLLGDDFPPPSARARQGFFHLVTRKQRWGEMRLHGLAIRCEGELVQLIPTQSAPRLSQGFSSFSPGAVVAHPDHNGISTAALTESVEIAGSNMENHGKS